MLHIFYKLHDSNNKIDINCSYYLNKIHCIILFNFIISRVKTSMMLYYFS